jgi:hypothetical protein
LINGAPVILPKRAWLGSHLPEILLKGFGRFQIGIDKLFLHHSKPASQPSDLFSFNVGETSRQQLAHVVQPIPAHTRLLVSLTCLSRSPKSRLDEPFKNRRNLQFSSSFSSASARIRTGSGTVSIEDLTFCSWMQAEFRPGFPQAWECYVENEVVKLPFQRGSDEVG